MKLPEFALERHFARHEFTARHLLSSSDVEPLLLGELLALADADGRERWDRLSLGYTESPGLPALRQEIAALYDSVHPDEILTFVGAEEAIFTLANVVLGPDDHAVVVWPCYQSLEEVARATTAEVTRVPLRHEDGWRVDVQAVGDAVRPNTRLVVVNAPHNPTGALPDPAQFAELTRIAAEAGAVLLSDEVYRLLEWPPERRLPGAVDAAPGPAVSIGVMSKAYGLAGLRVGWIATHDAALLARCAAFKDYLTICGSAPAEILALIALRAGDRLLERSRSIVRANMEVMEDALPELARHLDWIPPLGGTVAFPRLRGDRDSADLCERLVHDEGVMLLPGDVFGCPGHVRVGLGRAGFADGLARLAHYLRSE